MRRRGVVTCAVLFICLCAPADAQIVYSGDGQLYEIDAAGSDRRLFTTPTGRDPSDSEAAWSPDGTQLAVVHQHDPGDGFDWSRIDLLSADGETRRKLMRLERNAHISSPRWSPDGGRIAFARFTFDPDDEAHTSEIVVRTLDGTETTLVEQRTEQGLRFVATPEWSPDGGSVLYAAFRVDRREYFRSSIRSVPPTGGPTQHVASAAHSPVFSPDGSRIAFISFADRNGRSCGEVECSYNGELYVMDADGSDLRRLTHNRAHDLAPDWAPDGSRIVFNSSRNDPSRDTQEIYSIEPDGDCLTWLTNGTAESVDPVWRPDTETTDPDGCGATPRRPLIETDLAPMRAFTAARPMWLGQTYRGLLLSHIDRGAGLYLSYEDCASYRPSDCPRGLELSITSVCAPSSQVAFLRGRADRRRRALVQLYNPFDVRVLTGGLDVQIFGPRPLQSVRALRPFPRETRVERLRAPAVPAWLARQVERAARLHERLGSAAAVAKRTGLPRRVVRERLATAKTLDDFGHRVRTTRCSGARPD